MDYLSRREPKIHKKSKVVEALNMMQKDAEYKGEVIRIHTLVSSLADLIEKTGNKSKQLANFDVANVGFKLNVSNCGNGNCYTFYKKNREGFDIQLFNFNILPYKGNVNIYNDLQNDDFFQKTKINKEIFLKEVNRRVL